MVRCFEKTRKQPEIRLKEEEGRVKDMQHSLKLVCLAHGIFRILLVSAARAKKECPVVDATTLALGVADLSKPFLLRHDAGVKAAMVALHSKGKSCSGSIIDDDDLQDTEVPLGDPAIAARSGVGSRTVELEAVLNNDYDALHAPIVFDRHGKLSGAFEKSSKWQSAWNIVNGAPRFG